jgi:hypothetical protein
MNDNLSQHTKEGLKQNKVLFITSLISVLFSLMAYVFNKLNFNPLRIIEKAPNNFGSFIAIILLFLFILFILASVVSFIETHGKAFHFYRLNNENVQMSAFLFIFLSLIPFVSLFSYPMGLKNLSSNTNDHKNIFKLTSIFYILAELGNYFNAFFDNLYISLKIGRIIENGLLFLILTLFVIFYYFRYRFFERVYLSQK